MYSATRLLGRAIQDAHLIFICTDYLVSGLQTGCAVILFDGSPLFRPELLWDMAEELGVTVFGTVRFALDQLRERSLIRSC